MRRNKVATAAAALVFLSLLGGVIATTWEAHRAKLEKARAERRFNDVRQLAHSVLFDYHDAIKDLPGATRARERLVKDALIYLDGLTREAADDRELQRELAEAYERVGDVRGRAYSASLGDMTGAMESYLKALAIREALVAANPRDVQSRCDLARNYARVGRQLIETNHADRRTDYLRNALGIYLQLNAEHPASTAIRYELAGMYDELGLSLEDWWGDAPGALENHRQALALRQAFLLAEPDNQTHQRNLSVTYVNIGRALVLSGDVKAALESNEKGLALRKALFADHPNNADYRRLLAIGYQNDGNYRAMLQDVEGALRSFRNKLALDEEAVAEDPVNVQAREDLGYSCERIADLLAGSADYLEALSYYHKALALYERVWAVAPQILHLRYRIVFAHVGIGEMEANLGRGALALAECNKANALLDETPIDPNLVWQKTMRAQLYIHLGKSYTVLATSNAVSKQQEHWRTAQDMYQRSLDILKDLQQRGILADYEQREMEGVTRKLAECEVALRNGH